MPHMNADGHKQGRAAGGENDEATQPWLFHLDAGAGGGVFHHQAKLAQKHHEWHRPRPSFARASARAAIRASAAPRPCRRRGNQRSAASAMISTGSSASCSGSSIPKTSMERPSMNSAAATTTSALTAPSAASRYEFASVMKLKNAPRAPRC